MQTFWIPLVQHEYNIDAQDEDKAAKFQPPAPVRENKYAGAFLAKGLKAERAEIENQNNLNRAPAGNAAAHLLREVKKEELPDDMTFSKLVPKGYEKERDYLAQVTRELQERMAPKQTKKPKDFLEDPFVYIKNKEKASEVIGTAVDAYFSRNPKVYGNSGLSQDECEQLTLQAFKALRKAGVIHEEFEESSFSTSFAIYKDPSLNQVERTQLANFIKSVGDL